MSCGWGFSITFLSINSYANTLHITYTRTPVHVDIHLCTCTLYVAMASPALKLSNIAVWWTGWTLTAFLWQSLVIATDVLVVERLLASLGTRIGVCTCSVPVAVALSQSMGQFLDVRIITICFGRKFQCLQIPLQFGHWLSDSLTIAFHCSCTASVYPPPLDGSAISSLRGGWVNHRLYIRRSWPHWLSTWGVAAAGVHLLSTPCLFLSLLRHAAHKICNVWVGVLWS